MPKLTCPCGYQHNLSPIPDAGWVTIPDREFDTLTPGDGASLETWQKNWDKLLARDTCLYDCPDCGFMWSVPGTRCAEFRIFAPEKFPPSEIETDRK